MVQMLSKKRIAGWVAALSLAVSGAAVAQGEEQLTVTVTPLKDSLYVLQGRGGNVLASVGADGVLLIDGDYSQYAPAYDRAIQGIANSERAPRFLLNTHWHGDHTGANSYWSERGAVVVAHQNVRSRMASRHEGKTSGRVVEPSPVEALPVLTYESGLALHFNADDIEVRHFPTGHTDGDSVVFFSKANVVHMGDHFFNGRFPFVDRDSGGTVAGYSANVQAVLDIIDDQTIVVPGHGEAVANRDDLQRFQDMILATSADIRAKLAQGMTAQAITEQGLGERWDSWGRHFINEAAWISFVVAE